MRKVLRNTVLICLAFALGLSINHACADSLDNMTDKELRNLVSQLQNEVNILKQEVSELRAKIQSTGLIYDGTSLKNDVAELQKDVSDLKSQIVNGNQVAASGEFEVDGLWFSRNGQVSSRPMKYETIAATRFKDNSLSNLNSDTHNTFTYKYDSFGRYIGYEELPGTYSYSYSGKTLTVKSVLETEGAVTTTETVYTYQ